MAFDIRLLDQQTLPQFMDLQRAIHDPPWSAAFLERYVAWRYFGRRDWQLALLFVRGRCVAMIDVQRRHYFVNGRAMPIRETSEWFCLEAYRPLGLGVRLLQSLMSDEEPILSVRGTAANQELLPRLRWRELTSVHAYAAMLNWRHRCFELKQRLLTRSRAPNLQVVRGDPDVPACTELIEDMACHADLVPQVLSWEPEWMRSAPTEIGQFLWLSFYRDETLQGVLVARIYAGGDYRRGQIVQMYARDHAAATYVAMTKSCLRILRQEGVVRVRVRASAAPVQAAMQVCGFALEEQQPAYWWCNDDTDLATTAHLMFLRGDDYIRPFLPGQT